MIPLHLRISGFLSYREPVDLDFTGLDLACISGQNGAGKSTLLDAITWALFGIARKKDDSIINSACAAAEVAFTFYYEGNVYRIQRSRPREKTGILDLFIHTDPQACLEDPQVALAAGGWKPITEHSIRESEDTIRRTLHLDYDTFINASFFLQGKADLFSTRPPAERKKVLSAILGLEIWETYRQTAAERRRELEVECSRLDGLIEDIQAELADEGRRKAALADLQARLEQHQRARAALEATLENLRRLHQALDRQQEAALRQRERWQETQVRLQAQQATLKDRSGERAGFLEKISRAEEIEAAYQDWQAARQELQGLDQVSASFRQQEKAREQPRLEIETARARLQQEISALEQESRKAVESRRQLDTQRSQAASLQSAVQAAEAFVSSRAVVERDAANMKDMRSAARAEKPVLELEANKLKADIKRLENETGALCPVCGKPLLPSERTALIEIMNARVEALRGQYRQYETDLRSFDARLLEFETQLSQIGARERDLAQLQRQYDQACHQAQLLEESISHWETGGALQLAAVKESLAREEFAPAARQKLKEVDDSLQALGYDPARHDAVRQREQAGRQSEVLLRQLENARAALQPLEREISNLQKDCDALQARASEEETAWQTASREYEKAAAGAPPLEPVERELVGLAEQEHDLTMQVGAADQKVKILDTQRKRLEQLNSERDALTHRIGQYKTLERAFSKDGVPAMLIEQALPEIEIHANEILQRLSGGAMSVSFATQREYKDKSRDDRKETLDIRISDASGIRDYEMFSGGEAFRVNFAIRLALSRVLAHRAGASLQMLVIDEGFGSQDALGRQRLIEAITSVRSEFKCILVITHMEELKDYFPNRIEVEKGEQGSTVRVV